MHRARSLRALAAAALALALAGPARAEAEAEGGIARELSFGRVKVAIAAERAETAIVDPLAVTVSVEALDGLQVAFADHGGRLGPFRVTGEAAQGPFWAGKGLVRWQRRYLLAAEAAGEVTIPPLAVFVEDTSAISYIACVTMRGCGGGHIPGTVESRRLRTPPLTVTVTSVLPPDADPARPRDLAPPRALVRPAGPAGGLTPVLVAALVIVLVLGALAWRQRPRTALPTPVEPAHAVALAALARLEAELRAGQARVPDAFERLAAILRRYLAARFHLPAPARTTEEVLMAGAAHPALAGRQGVLARVLGQCDLVKFARRRAEAGDAKGGVANAMAFVRETAEALP